MSICTATFTGNIGRDAELKTVRDTELAEFSLAVTTGYGEKKATMWVRCTVWGKRASSLGKYLTKGTQIAVTGEPSVNGYLAKDGEARAELRLRVNEIELMGSRSGGGGRQENEDAEPPAKPAGKKVDPEDDIPIEL